MTPPDAIEMEVLEGLREVMEEDFEELLNDYLAQCDELWRETCAYFEAGDMTQLRRAAHTFKGSCLSIGAEPLMEQMKALEAAAAAGERDQAAQVIAAAGAEIDRVVAVLEEWRGPGSVC